MNTSRKVKKPQKVAKCSVKQREEEQAKNNAEEIKKSLKSRNYFVKKRDNAQSENSLLRLNDDVLLKVFSYLTLEESINLAE